MIRWRHTCLASKQFPDTDLLPRYMDEEQNCARHGRDLSPGNSRLLEVAQMQQELQMQVMELCIKMLLNTQP